MVLDMVNSSEGIYDMDRARRTLDRISRCEGSPFLGTYLILRRRHVWHPSEGPWYTMTLQWCSSNEPP